MTVAVVAEEKPETSLTPLENRILDVMAVLHYPIPALRLLEVLQALRLGGLMTVADLKRHLNGLKARDYLLEKSTRYWINPRLRERATRRAAANGLLPRVADYSAHLPHRPFPNYRCTSEGGYHDPDEVARDLRLAVYLQDEAKFHILLPLYSRFAQFAIDEVHPLYRMAVEPFDPDWLAKRCPAILNAMADKVFLGPQTTAARRFADWWLEQSQSMDDLSPHREILVPWWIHLGRFAEAEKLIEPVASTPFGLACRAGMAVLQGRHDDARSLFDVAMRSVKARSRSDFLDSPFALLYPLLLIAQDCHDEADKIVQRALAGRALGTWGAIAVALRVARGEVVSTVDLPALEGEFRGLPQLLAACTWFWCQPDSLKGHVECLKGWFDTARKRQWTWLAADLAGLLAKTGVSEYQTHVQDRSLLQLLQCRETWDRALAAIERHFERAEPEPPEAAELRLIWTVTVGSASGWACSGIVAREQKRTASGWTAGRPVSLKRLSEDWRAMPWLNDVDRRLCASITSAVHYSGGYPHDVYDIPIDVGIKHLVGHPHFYRSDDPTTPIRVDRGRPALCVEQSPDGFTLRLEPPGVTSHVRLVASNHLRYIEFTDRERTVAALLGAGLTVPQQAVSRIEALLERASASMAIRSDLGRDAAAQVGCDSRLHVKLVPAGTGLSGQVCVHPLGPEGPAFVPGTGDASVCGWVGGHAQQTGRDLALERVRWDRLREALPAVQPRGWTLFEPQDCLEMLDALGDLSDDVVVHWPEGVAFRLVGRLDWSHVRVRLSTLSDLLEVGGDVVVDEQQVETLSRFLGRRRTGRFVPLPDGRFVALTAEFERRLDALHGVVRTDGDRLYAHPSMLPLVRDMVDGAEIDTTADLALKLERLRAWKPVPVPTTLQADLRDYQVDGYQWLCRLSEWGAGACLADDMGLGKTVQVLAWLLHEAVHGPVLVVAPTSVCGNWLTEASRFAPTLSVRLYAGSERHLEGVGPHHLVVTSYSILVQSIEALSSVPWHGAVLDEAQAIKNPTTQRFKAALALKATHRVAMTGTPVENHLTDVWSIFRFLSPGLLGSREEFDRGDHSRGGLRRLLSPFLLRRTKLQVLSELPARTDITLTVELSSTERALYESVRRAALMELKEAPQRMQVLGHLMRLRRACCHPCMVTGAADDMASLSSKLVALGRLLRELRDNKHRALIFSQFVDHLAAVRTYLDEQAIPYQYLDGSTPMSAREQQIADFQAGRGDVFLISLRAGGSGLNLTAADYVVHLDPWWNPAVEDQATDRAHRIGQTRPVTIYRFVAKDTIEERILELHSRKRDLALDLLEGTDGSAGLTVDELMQFFQQA